MPRDPLFWIIEATRLFWALAIMAGLTTLAGIFMGAV